MGEVTTGRHTDRRGRARCAGCDRRRVIVGRTERCVECWASGPLVDDDVLLLDDLIDARLDELRAADVAAGSDCCEMCGCTERFGCPEGCWWAAPGLCSECATGLDLLAEMTFEDYEPGRPTDTVDARGYL